ncbi:mitochondrial outer membrane protein porin 2-like [Silene latifolia]|uniref:mitochondrial outer membrane protein porin 2-like n=1 Tax=Silene latifolia TaxID=37657 RepID=UPI003D785B45
MSKVGVGLFSDIGKTAREILYKDYNYDRKFSITTQASDGLALTSTALQKGKHTVGDVAALYRYKNAAIDVKVDTQSNIDTRVTLTDVLPSVKTIASIKLPDMNSAKVEVQYFHEHATIGSSLSLRNPPIFDISATCGTATTVFGVEAAYNSSIGNFTKYNAGISMMEPGFCTTLTLADKGDLLTASYVRYLDQLKATTAVEFTNRFSEDGNTLTVGGSYNFDESTLIKLKLNNQGNFGVLLQNEIKPKTLLTMAAEFDYNSIDTSPKIGVSLALRP